MLICAGNLFSIFFQFCPTEGKSLDTPVVEQQVLTLLMKSSVVALILTDLKFFDCLRILFNVSPQQA